MYKSIQIEEFLKLAESFPVMDVRTPAEFLYGHIPNAINLPLFTDEERKIAGTIYEQQGRKPAILKGLELVGPKLKGLVMTTSDFEKGNTLLLYCWRGGMRSSSVAWLLEMYGFKIYVLKGGYKSFRRLAHETFLQARQLRVLSGRTGSGKTMILNELFNLGEQTIDLEKLANHKGSSFGSLGELQQPSQEHFENLLASDLKKLNPDKIVWIEDESRSVGKKIIPETLWLQMRSSRVVYLDIPFDERVENLVLTYGKFPINELKEAVIRVQKRLGGLNFKIAMSALESGDLKRACEIMLFYYDKSYDFGVQKRDPSLMLTYTFGKIEAQKIAKEIIDYGKN